MAHSVTTVDNGPYLVRVSIAMIAIAALFVALRFVTRGWLVRKYGLDDLFIVIALVFGTGEAATMLLQVKHGRGRHSDEVGVDELNKMNMYRYINMLLYYIANWAVKMSVLALYHRICTMQKGSPWFLRGAIVWAMAATITAFTLSFFLAEVFSCMPMSNLFDLTDPGRQCISWAPFYISQSGLNVVMDSILVAFPLPLLGILKIDRKQRYALVLILSIGLLPLVATIIRLCLITSAVETQDISRPYGDTSWKWRWIPLWSQIEVDVGIVAASLPSLSPLLKQMVAHSRDLSPSQLPTLLETALKSRADIQELQKLPSSISTLPNRSISTLGGQDDAKRFTFLDDGRDSMEEADCDLYETQIGVARTVDTRLSRASFVNMPVSPRRSIFPQPSIPEAVS